MAGHLATGGYDADYGHAEGDFEKAEQLRGEITCVPETSWILKLNAMRLFLRSFIRTKTIL